MGFNFNNDEQNTFKDPYADLPRGDGSAIDDDEFLLSQRRSDCHDVKVAKCKDLLNYLSPYITQIVNTALSTYVPPSPSLNDLESILNPEIEQLINNAIVAYVPPRDPLLVYNEDIAVLYGPSQNSASSITMNGTSVCMFTKLSGTLPVATFQFSVKPGLDTTKPVFITYLYSCTSNGAVSLTINNQFLGINTDVTAPVLTSVTETINTPTTPNYLALYQSTMVLEAGSLVLGDRINFSIHRNCDNPNDTSVGNFLLFNVNIHQ